VIARSLLVVLATALAVPAAAGAQWAPPSSPTGDVTAALAPQVAFTASGTQVVAYGADGRFGWNGRLTTTTDPFARLLPYTTDRVLVVSQTHGRRPELRARFGSVAGALGAVHRLTPGDDVLRDAPAISVGGDAVVAYLSLAAGKRQVRVVHRLHGGSFGRPETIAGAGGPSAVAAAVAPSGEQVVAYEREGRVEVRRRSRGGRWAAFQAIGPAEPGHTQIEAAARPDGSFAVAWFAQALSEGGDNGAAAVRYAVRSAGGHRFHSTRTLETFAERAPQEAGVHVGDGVVGWTGRQGGHWVARAADLATGVGQTLSDPATDAVLGGIGAGLDGRAVAVWAPPLDTPSPQVFAAVRPAGAPAFGLPETVSPAYREVATPTVAVSPRDGTAVAAWVARTGDRTQAVLASVRGGS
jgi:hypothetical protein